MELSVSFGTRPGLAAVSLAVARGERLAVLGPSGVGKSTLLRAVAGLAPVAAGRILVRGRDVTALPPEQRDAVYLHQSPVLFPHLSVADNVAFPLRVRGQRGADADTRVREALAAEQLADLASGATGTLSGGQRHRVALARAMVARPAALLLDEPLAALDPALRDDVRGAIADAQAAQGAEAPALVLVTHDLDDAALLADQVVVLLDGRVAHRSVPAELFTQPQSLAVARFLGLFQELPGRVVGANAVECALGVVTSERASSLMPGAHAVVAFRASAVEVTAVESEGAVPALVVGARHRAHGVSVALRVDVRSPEGVALDAAVPEQGAMPLVGARVGIRLDASRALVFPR